MNIKLERQHMSAYRRRPLMVLFIYRGTVTCTLTWPVACVLYLPIQGITGSMGTRQKIVRQVMHLLEKKTQLHHHHHHHHDRSVEVGITHEVWFSLYQMKCPYILKRDDKGIHSKVSQPFGFAKINFARLCSLYLLHHCRVSILVFVKSF